jgi:hypothetical protein
MPSWSRFSKKQRGTEPDSNPQPAPLQLEQQEILEPLEGENLVLNSLGFRNRDNSSHSASINCIFRNRESRWGRASDQGAAVLILYVTLAQPAGYKLRDATLNLYLLADELDSSVRGPAATDVAPRGVYGLATESKGNRVWQVQPEIAAGELLSVGGVGYNNAKEYLEKHFWLFETSLQQGKNRRVTATQFVWQANPDNKQNEQCGPLMVALGLLHSEKPFLIGFEIAGKLKGGFHTYKYSGRALTRLTPKPAVDNLEGDLTLEKLEAITKKVNEGYK